MTDKLDHFLAWLSRNMDALLIGSAVAAGLVLLMLLLRAAGHAVVRSDPNCLSWKGVIGRVLSRTGLFFMAAAALEIVVSYAEPPARIGRLFDIAFIVAFALQGAIWGRELILGVIGSRIAENPTENSTLGNAIGVIRVLVSVALFGIAMVVILDNLGVNVTALVAGLGIGGIAIGLAAQGIFSDLFAALAILFDRPFRVGDTISYGTSTGTVEAIGLKTTRIRALSGEQLIMANTKLLDQQVSNMRRIAERRVVMTFGILRETAPETVAAVPAALAGIVAATPHCRFDRAHVHNIGPSGLDIELVFHVEEPDYGLMMDARQAVVLGILKRFTAMEVRLSYPAQIGFTAAPDASLVDPRSLQPTTEPT